MSKIYERYKITITVFILFGISMVFGGVIAIVTELTKGITTVVDLVIEYKTVSMVIVVFVFISMLVVADVVRYHVFKEESGE